MRRKVGNKYDGSPRGVADNLAGISGTNSTTCARVRKLRRVTEISDESTP